MWLFGLRQVLILEDAELKATIDIVGLIESSDLSLTTTGYNFLKKIFDVIMWRFINVIVTLLCKVH